MEDHYQCLSAVVTSRAILSLGLACFKWSKTGLCSAGPVPLMVEVYNIWLLIQQPFLTDPNSAQFLVNHGFDFNKQYSKGLPYLPPAARTEVRINPLTVRAVLSSIPLPPSLAPPPLVLAPPLHDTPWIPCWRV